MEYIITFKSTNLAIKAEHCLTEQKFKITVIPLPTQISAGCGICLGVSQDEIKPALMALADRNINEIGLFIRAKENQRFIYTDTSVGRIIQG